MKACAAGYAMPSAQLGYLSPLPVVDAMHHEFYQAVPHGIVFVSYPLSASAFTPQAAMEVLDRSADGMAYLSRRGVGRAIFGGLPISALVGRTAMLEHMRRAQAKYGLEVSSDFEDTVLALRGLGARRVALAAKWKPPVMAAVAQYLADAGFDVAGVQGDAFDAADVMLVDTLRSAALALELGRRALRAFPDVDALVLGGGTWLAIPATHELEAEFGKPVVSNMVASAWNAARHARVPTAPDLGCSLFDISFSQDPDLP